MRPRAPRGWYWDALQTLELDRCPSTVQYRLEPSAPCRADFTNHKRISALTILELAAPPMKRAIVNATGYFSHWRFFDTEAYCHMRAFYEGTRWEQIPEYLRGRVAQAIKEFRRELEKEGYDVG